MVEIDLVEHAREFNLKEFNRLSDSMNKLASKKVNDRIEIFIGQMIIHSNGFNFERSNHMAILIVDYKTYRHIGMRLSTFRKIISFVSARGWLEARRLKWFEKMKLNRQWEDCCEKLTPGFKEHISKNKLNVSDMVKGLGEFIIQAKEEMDSQRKKKLEKELQDEKLKVNKSQKRVDSLEKRLKGSCDG